MFCCINLKMKALDFSLGDYSHGVVHFLNFDNKFSPIKITIDSRIRKTRIIIKEKFGITILLKERKTSPPKVNIIAKISGMIIDKVWIFLYFLTQFFLP